MTPTSPDESLGPPSAADPVGPLPLVRAAGLAVRVVSVGAVLACGLILLQTYRTLFDEYRTPAAPPQRDPREVAPPLPPGLPTALPGRWSFGDQEWAAAWDAVPADKLAGRMAAPADAEVPAGPPSELESQVLGWLKQQQGPKSAEGDTTVYEPEFGTARLRVVTALAGGTERVRAVRAAWPAAGDKWSFAEVLPRAGGGRRDEHLLPLRPGVESLARRWDTDGRLAAELLRTAEPTEALAGDWAARGWQLLAADPVSFSLARGGRTVRGWRLAGGGPQAPGGLVFLLADPPAGPTPDTP